MSTAAGEKTAVTLLDLASLIVAFVTGLALWVDTDLFVRPIASLVFIVFVPGWVVLRFAAVPFSSLMVLSACVVSVVLMVLTSFLLATRLDWIWAPVARLWTFGCVGALAVILMRDVRSASVSS